jgi:phage terminase Nu1 subunit (DNA packaging protein)
MTLYDAIYQLNPTVVTIRNDVAYDKDENIVEYDLAAAEAKFAELQNAANTAAQVAATAKTSAIDKLTALGLTADEIAHLIP